MFSQIKKSISQIPSIKGPVQFSDILFVSLGCFALVNELFNIFESFCFYVYQCPSVSYGILLIDAAQIFLIYNMKKFCPNIGPHLVSQW